MEPKKYRKKDPKYTRFENGQNKIFRFPETFALG
jgi:hypothetical protein